MELLQPTPSNSNLILQIQAKWICIMLQQALQQIIMSSFSMEQNTLHFLVLLFEIQVLTMAG